MLQATINRNLTKATKVQVAYAKDAPLLATTYKDYQVATDADFTLTNGGAFEIGTETRQIQIPVTVKNMGKFTKPTVIPVRITPSDEALKSPKSSRDYAYIVIKQEELWTVYAGSSDITVNLEGTNNKYIGESSVTVWFTVAKAFTGKGKVGTRRNLCHSTRGCRRGSPNSYRGSTESCGEVYSQGNLYSPYACYLL